MSWGHGSIPPFPIIWLTFLLAEHRENCSQSRQAKFKLGSRAEMLTVEGTFKRLSNFTFLMWSRWIGFDSMRPEAWVWSWPEILAAISKGGWDLPSKPHRRTLNKVPSTYMTMKSIEYILEKFQSLTAKWWNLDRILNGVKVHRSSRPQISSNFK